MDFLGQLLSKQQAPPPPSDARKKQLAAAKKADDARRKYISNYRVQAAKAVDDFIQDAARMKMKFAPAEKAVRGIIYEIAEERGLVAHTFGEEGVDRYVYIYKKEYNLTEAELACYRERRKWDASQLPTPPTPLAPSAPSAPPAPLAPSTPPVMTEISTSSAPREEVSKCLKEKAAVPVSRRKAEVGEREMARMSAASAELVQVSRESFGNVPVSVKTDKRTMAQVQTDIRAKRLKAQAKESDKPTDRQTDKLTDKLTDDSKRDVV